MEIEFLQSLNINKQNSKHDFLLERQEKLEPFDNDNGTKQRHKRNYETHSQDLNELGGAETTKETLC
jgi:hypothetical protein